MGNATVLSNRGTLLTGQKTQWKAATRRSQASESESNPAGVSGRTPSCLVLWARFLARPGARAMARAAGALRRWLAGCGCRVGFRRRAQRSNSKFAKGQGVRRMHRNAELCGLALEARQTGSTSINPVRHGLEVRGVAAPSSSFNSSPTFTSSKLDDWSLEEVCEGDCTPAEDARPR